MYDEYKCKLGAYFATLGFPFEDVVVLIALFSIKFRQFYLTLVFNEISIKFIIILKDILAKTQKQYSYTCFILFHFYIAFSIFHFMMLYFYEIEVTFEILYQLLNLIRLFFFFSINFINGYSHFIFRFL